MQGHVHFARACTFLRVHVHLTCTCTSYMYMRILHGHIHGDVDVFVCMYVYIYTYTSHQAAGVLSETWPTIKLCLGEAKLGKLGANLAFVNRVHLDDSLKTTRVTEKVHGRRPATMELVPLSWILQPHESRAVHVAVRGCKRWRQ